MFKQKITENPKTIINIVLLGVRTSYLVRIHHNMAYVFGENTFSHENSLFTFKNPGFAQKPVKLLKSAQKNLSR